MDVNNPNAGSAPKRRPRGAEARRARERAASGPRAEASPGGHPSDEARLSDQTRQPGDLEAAANGEAFDRHRVGAIRTAIAEGRYHVAPERLARRFLELEILLNQ